LIAIVEIWFYKKFSARYVFGITSIRYPIVKKLESKMILKGFGSKLTKGPYRTAKIWPRSPMPEEGEP